jgi:2-dehydropantoate 2-reductase
MPYVVFGAGAIGAVVGGRLSQAGYDVELIARGAHLQALKAGGLRLESPESTDTLRLGAVSHPREIDWSTSPVVLLAVKSQQSLAALSALAAVAPAQTPIVCLQNGIANEPAACACQRPSSAPSPPACDSALPCPVSAFCAT